jgi:hypothetical protein
VLSSAKSLHAREVVDVVLMSPHAADQNPPRGKAIGDAPVSRRTFKGPRALREVVIRATTNPGVSGYEQYPAGVRRAARSQRHLVYGAHCYLVGIAQPPTFFRTGSRHSRALKARRAIPGAWRKLAGHSTYGNRCSSIVVGCEFLTFGALMR